MGLGHFEHDSKRQGSKLSTRSDKTIDLSAKWRSHLLRSPWAKPDGLLAQEILNLPEDMRSTLNLINEILPFLPAARTSSDPGFGLYSDHMLAELIALQEGMIVQLRLERLSVIGTAGFLANLIDHFLLGVIDQHEKAAALLWAQFENLGADC